MELLLVGLFIVITIGLTHAYNLYESKVRKIEITRNKLIKEYHYCKYISIDLLHTNMLGTIIDNLDSKKTLKEKLQFIENL